VERKYAVRPRLGRDLPRERTSRIRSHHLHETFWGWRDEQLLGGTDIQLREASRERPGEGGGPARALTQKIARCCSGVSSRHLHAGGRAHKHCRRQGLRERLRLTLDEVEQFLAKPNT
jgi:hypothetical protein